MIVENYRVTGRQPKLSRAIFSPLNSRSLPTSVRLRLFVSPSPPTPPGETGSTTGRQSHRVHLPGRIHHRQTDNLTEAIYLGESTTGRQSHLSPSIWAKRCFQGYLQEHRWLLHLSTGDNSQRHPWSPVHKLRAVPRKASPSAERRFAAFIALGHSSVNLLTL